MRCGSCGRTVTRNKAIHATCETRAAEKRYTPGQRFSWHADAPFARENGELSLLTFMIYLNDGYEGGATRFESSLVAGKLGTALLFEHGLIHEGAEVTAGVK